MMNNDEALAKRNLSDFKRYCQLMDKACGGSLDAYIVSWMNGDGRVRARHSFLSWGQPRRSCFSRARKPSPDVSVTSNSIP